MPQPKINWKMDLTEKIIACASATARVEYIIKQSHGLKVNLGYPVFKAKVIAYAEDLAKSRHPYLQKEFDQFMASFKQSMASLEKGEDSILEGIIKKEHGRFV